jgi:Cys-tRNA synthase (O-phospho-L-seryl-tRNA:Cys-tRNA synthase)
MPFKSLNIQQEYRSPQNNIVTEFYIPVLEKAVSYKRSVGYFSSTSLVQITKGILGLIKNGGTIDLVASPYLSKEDEAAIIEAVDEILDEQFEAEKAKGRKSRK